MTDALQAFFQGRTNAVERLSDKRGPASKAEPLLKNEGGAPLDPVLAAMEASNGIVNPQSLRIAHACFFLMGCGQAMAWTMLVSAREAVWCRVACGVQCSSHLSCCVRSARV